MPRYYCDYCDMYLTHDSAGGRKEHIRGWKHRENVIAYFKPALRNFQSSGEGNAWQGWQQSQRGGAAAPPLPTGWVARTRGEGLSKHEACRPYYVHLATGHTTWTHPMLLRSNTDSGEYEKPWLPAEQQVVCPPCVTPTTTAASASGATTAKIGMAGAAAGGR